MFAYTKTDGVIGTITPASQQKDSLALCDAH